MEHELIIQWKPDQEGHRYHVGIRECPETRGILSSGELEVQGNWTSKPLARTSVLHLASNGRGPHVTILGPAARAETGGAPGAESAGVKLKSKARKTQLMASKSALVSEHTASVMGRYALRALPKGAAAAAAGKSKKRKAQEDAASPQDLEVLLAPVVVKDTKTGAAAEDGPPLFWGYCLDRGAADAANRALVECRLAVVASLENDGPLVQSYTVSELEAELQRAVAAREDLAAAMDQQMQHPQQHATAAGEGDGAVRQGKKKRRRAGLDATAIDAGDNDGTAPAVARLHQSLSDVKAHEARVSGYLALLNQFDGKTPLIYNGTTYKPKLEKVASPVGPQPIKQHVLRIPAPEPGLDALVLIESQRKPMLVRVRQHWEELRGLLGGVPATDVKGDAPAEGAGKAMKKAKAGTGATSAADAHEEGPATSEVPRFDFLPWINPGRQPDWLMELWHVLDPKGEVITADDLRTRANSIHGSTTRFGASRGECDGQRQLPRLEPLRYSDRAGRAHGDAVMQDAAAAEAAGHDVRGGLGPPPVALTVVLDERREVWGEELQSSVLQLLPWQAAGMPEAALAAGQSKKETEAADNELQRVCTALLHLHAEVFKPAPWKRVKRGGRLLGMEGAPEEQLRGAAAPGSTAAEELIGPLPNVAEVLWEAAHPSLVRPAVRRTPAGVVAPAATGAAAGASGAPGKSGPLVVAGASHKDSMRIGAGAAPVHSTPAVDGGGPSMADAPPAAQKQSLLLLPAVQEPVLGNGGPAAVPQPLPMPQAATVPPLAGPAAITPQQVMETSRRLLKSPYTMSVCAAKLLVEELIPPLRTLTSFMLPHLATSAMALVPGMTHTMANEMQAMVSSIYVQLGAMEDFMAACASATATATANGVGNGGDDGDDSSGNAVKSLERRFQDVQARNRQLACAAKVTVGRYGVHMVSATAAQGNIEPPVPHPGKATAAASAGTGAGTGTGAMTAAAAAAGGSASVGKSAGMAAAGSAALPPRSIAAARGAPAAPAAVRTAAPSNAAAATPLSSIIPAEIAVPTGKTASAAAASEGNAASSKDKSSSNNSSSSSDNTSGSGTSNSTSSGTSKGTSSGTSKGTSSSTSSGTSKRTSKGASSGTSSGTSKGASSSTSSGTSKGTSSGASKGTNSSTSSGTSKGASSGTSKDASSNTSSGTSKDASSNTSSGTSKDASSSTSSGTSKGTSSNTSSGTSKGTSSNTSSGTSKGTSSSTSSGTSKGTSSSNGTDEGGDSSDGDSADAGLQENHLATVNDGDIAATETGAVRAIGAVKAAAGGGEDCAPDDFQSGGQAAVVTSAAAEGAPTPSQPPEPQALHELGVSGSGQAASSAITSASTSSSSSNGDGSSSDRDGCNSSGGTANGGKAVVANGEGVQLSRHVDAPGRTDGGGNQDDGAGQNYGSGGQDGIISDVKPDSSIGTGAPILSADAWSDGANGPNVVGIAAETGASQNPVAASPSRSAGFSPGSHSGSGTSSSSSSSSESDASTSSSSDDAEAEDNNDGPGAVADQGTSPGSRDGTSSESGTSSSSSSSSESDASTSSSSDDAEAEDNNDGPGAVADQGTSPGSRDGTSSESGTSSSSSSSSESDASASSSSDDAEAEDNNDGPGAVADQGTSPGSRDGTSSESGTSSSSSSSSESDASSSSSSGDAEAEDSDDSPDGVAAEGSDSRDGGKSDGNSGGIKGKVDCNSSDGAAHADAVSDSEAEREAQMAAAVEAMKVQALPPSAFMTPMPTLPAVSPLSQQAVSNDGGNSSTSSESARSDSGSSNSGGSGDGSSSSENGSKSSGSSSSENGSKSSGSSSSENGSKSSGSSSSEDGSKSSGSSSSEDGSKSSGSGNSAGSPPRPSESGPSAGGDPGKAEAEIGDAVIAAELGAAGGASANDRYEGLIAAAAAASLGVAEVGGEASGGATATPNGEAAAVGNEAGAIEDSDITLPPSEDGESQQLYGLAAADGGVDKDSGLKSGQVEDSVCGDIVLLVTQAAAAATAAPLGIDGSAGTACTGDERAVGGLKRKAPSNAAAPDGVQVVLPDPDDTLTGQPAAKKRRKEPVERPAEKMEIQQGAARTQLQEDQPQGGQLQALPLKSVKQPPNKRGVTLRSRSKPTADAVGANDADRHALPSGASCGGPSADVPTTVAANKRPKIVAVGPDGSPMLRSEKPVDQYEIPSSDTLGDGGVQEDDHGDVKSSDVRLRSAGRRGRGTGRGQGRGAGSGYAGTATVGNAVAPGSELPIEGRGRGRPRGQGRASGPKGTGPVGVAEGVDANVLDLELSCGGRGSSLLEGRTRRSGRVATGTAGAADSVNVNAGDAMKTSSTEGRGRGRQRRGSGR